MHLRHKLLICRLWTKTFIIIYLSLYRVVAFGPVACAKHSHSWHDLRSDCIFVLYLPAMPASDLQLVSARPLSPSTDCVDNDLLPHFWPLGPTDHLSIPNGHETNIPKPIPSSLSTLVNQYTRFGDGWCVHGPAPWIRVWGILALSIQEPRQSNPTHVDGVLHHWVNL